MAVNALQKTIKELYLNQDVDIDTYAEEYLNVYIDAYLNRSVSKFSEEGKAFSHQLEALREYLKIDEDIEHKRIYCFAMIDTIKNLGDKIAALDSCEVGQYSNYKYIYSILEVLYNNGTVSVGNMADLLQVERHTLTNAIRRANKFELWIQKKQGRNSLYQITSRGERAYVAFIKEETLNNRQSFDNFFNFLLKEIENHMLESQPDVNEIIRNLNHQLGCSAFSSTMIKISIQNIFKKRNIYIKKYNDLKRDYFKNNMETGMDDIDSGWGVLDKNDFQGEDMYRYNNQIEYRLKYNSFLRKEVG